MISMNQKKISETRFKYMLFYIQRERVYFKKGVLYMGFGDTEIMREKGNVSPSQN